MLADWIKGLYLDNITQQVTEQGTHDYIYDLINRLTNATHASLPDEGYSYDPIGSRLTDSRDAGPWSYNANNQLTANPGASFDYDANGSLIEKTEGADTFQYVYNLENRMASVDGPTDASYYYDPFGRRLWKQVGGVRTYFHYTDWGLAGEYQGSSQASLTQVQGYGFLPQGLWSTDPVYTRRNGQYYYYLNDHLGTPQKLIDSSGAVKWSADYEAFGETRNESGEVPNPLRFPGQYEDVETGSYYNYFRDYDPSLGRYVQSDPIGLDGGRNIYLYSNAMPIIQVDVLGLAPAVAVDNVWRPKSASCGCTENCMNVDDDPWWTDTICFIASIGKTKKKAPTTPIVKLPKIKIPSYREWVRKGCVAYFRQMKCSWQCGPFCGCTENHNHASPYPDK